MNIKGRLSQIDATQELSGGFRKREFIIETEGEYPQLIRFELLKDKVDIIDSFQTGKIIDVHFNIQGREFNGKVYNNLIAWKVLGDSGFGN